MVSGVAKLILAVLDESNNFENLANGVDAVMELANKAKVCLTLLCYLLIRNPEVGAGNHRFFLH